MKTPFRIEAREEGKGRPSVERFATIEAASEYIKARWQGAEYADGAESFHTDYCAYRLRGFTLADVGTFSFDGFDRVFTFKADAPKPACAVAGSQRCVDDSCDGSHCRACGGHFVDFYQTQHAICRGCQIEADASERAADEAEARCMRSDGFDPAAPFPHASDPHWSSPEADFARW